MIPVAPISGWYARRVGMTAGDRPQCALCGTPCHAPFRMPRPETAPDLDMRPGEPARSTLSDWMQTCRSCGAAAPSIAALPDNARAVVTSAAYAALSASGLSATLPFRRWATICTETGNVAGGADALLQAAWAADDALDGEEAIRLRQQVAEIWAVTADTETALRRLDVLRRAGAFEEAQRQADALATRPLDELGERVVAFQRARASGGDSGRYLVSSALPPPAHKPHVSHGKRAKGGFWSRLLGRR